MTRSLRMLIVPVFAAVLVGCASSGAGGEEGARAARYTPDIFPRGFASPKGAACELVRSFVHRDEALFHKAVARPAWGSRHADRYEAFLDEVGRSLRRAQEDGVPPLGAPVSLEGVGDARRLPASLRSPAAYQLIGADELWVVEVDARLNGRGVETNRILVVRDPSTAAWRALPRPELFGLLAAGTLDEPLAEISAGSDF